MGSYYRDVYKFAGTRPMFQSGKIRKSPMRRGLYSLDEVNNLVTNENYIPVATAAELDALRTATTQTMGAGTIWEGEYLTGLNKKYVQVDDLDLGGKENMQALGSLANRFTGTYDGNKLNINNYKHTQSSGFAGLFVNEGTLINIIAVSGLISGYTDPLAPPAILCMINYPDGIINNCSVLNSEITHNGTSSLLCGSNNGTIEHSDADGILNATQITRLGSGLICAENQSTGVIKHCISNGTLNGFNGDSLGHFCGIQKGVIEDSEAHGTIDNPGDTGDKYFGGFLGNCDATTAKTRRCFTTVNVTGYRYGGGFCGFSRGASMVIEDCYATGSVTLTNQYAAGFIARCLTSGTVKNSYSTGAVSGSANTGGFCAQNTATITNCYYDTQTSGQSDTGKGLPRTTLQMQQGTADSFILPAGGIDGDSLAANAMYTGWSVAIWKFTPMDKYPTLL